MRTPQPSATAEPLDPPRADEETEPVTRGSRHRRSIPPDLYGLLPLVLILLAGAALRLYAMDVYRPSPMTMADSTAYVWDAAGNLFGDAVRPGGYSLFLRAAHLFSSNLTFTIALQHLFGLLTAVVLYLSALRLGASRWFALLPAGVVALSGDQIFLEHTLLSESTFTFVLCCSVYAAIRTLDSSIAVVWGAAAGGLVASAATIRTVGLALVPLFGLWVLLSLRGPWTRRVIAGGATLAAGVAVLGLYAGLQARSVGTWDLGRSSGWALYSRVAPFADCGDFTPPAGTRFLCEAVPPSQRQGPEYYGWIGGPARARFGAPPNGDQTLQRFATAVVIHEPVEYTKVVTKDVVRYFVPTFGFDRPANGTGPELFTFDRRAPGVEEGIEQAVESYYDPFTLRLSAGGVRALASYQELVRVHGILFLELILVGVAGVFWTHGSSRRGLILLLLTIGLLLLVPAATTVYSARYGVPVEGLTAAAAAVALSLLVERLRAKKPDPQPSAA